MPVEDVERKCVSWGAAILAVPWQLMSGTGNTSTCTTLAVGATKVDSDELGVVDPSV